MDDGLDPAEQERIRRRDRETEAERARGKQVRPR